MRRFISMALAFAMLATSSVTFAGTSEARHRDRDRYYYDHGNRDYYYDRHRHRRHNNNDVAAAAVIGLALGAIIIGSQQNRRTQYYDRNDRYESRDGNWDHIRRCERRYRSYDRYSDTFIGRDGRRYYCNL